MANVTEDSMLRTSMICMDKNVYMYTNNAKILVTGGTLDLKLKTVTGEVIP